MSDYRKSTKARIRLEQECEREQAWNTTGVGYSGFKSTNPAPLCICERPNRKRPCGGIRTMITACKYRITAAAGWKFKKSRGRAKNECQSGGYEFFTIGSDQHKWPVVLSLVYFGERARKSMDALWICMAVMQRERESEWVQAGGWRGFIQNELISLYLFPLRG